MKIATLKLVRDLVVPGICTIHSEVRLFESDTAEKDLNYYREIFEITHPGWRLAVE